MSTDSGDRNNKQPHSTMKIAVIGADGQLGSDLVKILEGEELFPLYYPGFDITRPETVKEVLFRMKPDIVVNTAAFHRVDECEASPWEAFKVNTLAVRDLALICREMDSILVHFSTDYVFDGEKKSPYIEEDTPRPLNVYGVSKLAGEYFVRQILDRHFLIRSCGLYGEAGCWEKGSNFVDAMISLAMKGSPIRVVDDQWVTPTSTVELASRINELIRTGFYGLYHLTNEGECTWYEFARTIFSMTGKAPELIPVDSRTFGSRAGRPSYSVLENRKAKTVGLTEFSHWQDALRTYLEKKGYARPQDGRKVSKN